MAEANKDGRTGNINKAHHHTVCYEYIQNYVGSAAEAFKFDSFLLTITFIETMNLCVQ